MDQSNAGGKHVTVDNVDPIPVSASIDTSELALEAGHLATIDTNIGKLSAQILDLDTGGGTAFTAGFFIALPASGGPVPGGTEDNPLVVSPAAASNFAYEAGGNLESIKANTDPLDGRLTSILTLLGNGSQVTQIVDEFGTPITATSAALDVHVANATLAVTQSGTWSITNVSGTISLPTGAATSALQGVTDTDDASIASGQTAAVSLALSQVYDGSVWRRFTVGTAGTASSQVITIQGIASMTKLLVTPDANSAINVAQVNGHTAVEGGVNGSLAVGGPTASGSSIAANPLTTGGRAATAPPTAVSNGQVVNAQLNIYGEQIVRHALRETKGVQQTSISNTTNETTIVTADATYKLDLYGLVLANTGASATKVTIKDSTTGTTRAVFQVPAGETRGFMLPASDGIKQNAANNNWTATCATATTAMEVTALTVQNL